MKLIVTRPAAQAAEWVAELRRHGVEAVALPLIGIVPARDAAAVTAAWAALPARQLAMFVSPNAAEQFFALRPAAASWPESTLAGSPGPGTSRVLRGLGVPAEQLVEPRADAAQFDSESLWMQLRERNWHGTDVLIVRGESGRDWLAERLREAGARVGFVTAYERAAPTLSAAESDTLRAALASPEAYTWMFSSSESIDRLQALAPGADWGGAHALATHPRIAARARDAGFGSVLECRPALEAVVACLQSFETSQRLFP